MGVREPHVAASPRDVDASANGQQTPPPYLRADGRSRESEPERRRRMRDERSFIEEEG
jgi:hypothetical protein